jgi:hypothetical protein
MERVIDVLLSAAWVLIAAYVVKISLGTLHPRWSWVPDLSFTEVVAAEVLAMLALRGVLYARERWRA